MVQLFSVPVLAFLVFALLLNATNSLQISAKCLNNGTPLNSTTCICPPFVDGSLCENVKCQRFSIPDKNRCVCPPGWYDKACGLRGCRPPNEDNLDLQKRSFIIVFNMKKSMSQQLEVLKTAFVDMVNHIITNANTGEVDNWIANFIFYGFVQKGSKLEVKKLITEDAREFLDFLDTVELSDGDENQPVLTALTEVQQTFTSMKPHSIVLVLTDSPASDATPWSHRFSDKNAEQTSLQISLLWRSKVTFILSLPTGTDFSTDSVNVYQRLSLTNHADTLFVKSKNETDEIVRNVITKYCYPENLSVGYGIRGNKTVELTRDNRNDVLFILITFNPNSINEITGFDVKGADLYSNGSYYKLYFSLDDDFINIFSDSPLTEYNYRVFIQSKNTILFDYNDDMTIDVGNGMAVIGIEMSASMQLIGFDTTRVLNTSYHVLSSDNSHIRDKLFSYERPQLDCTFKFGFPIWDTLQCPPGPITQVHTLHYDGSYFQRVTPGYCIESDHNADPPIESAQTERLDGDGIEIVCDTININAVNDPRLEGPKQFIFILEKSHGNKAIYQTLAAEIGQIVEFSKKENNGSYENEYTLITYDDKESHVLLSTYNPNKFVAQFPSLIESINYFDSLDSTVGLLSIVQAQKLNIQPTSQIYYFTNRAVKNVQNISRNWEIVDRNVEINIFSIDDGNNIESSISIPWQLELVQKMSNGRFIPLESSEKTISKLFEDIIAFTWLTTDDGNYDCQSTLRTFEVFAELGSDSVVLQLRGNGISLEKLIDGNGTSISYTTSFASSNFISIRIDSSHPQNLTSGPWKATVSTTSGECQLTSRQKSNRPAVVFGFTSSITNDVVNSQIPTQRAENDESIYITMKIGNQVSIISPSLEIRKVNQNPFGFSTNYVNSSFVSRNAESCAFSFVSSPIQILKEELTSVIFTAHDSNFVDEISLRRIFYFYQRLPIDVSVCHGEKVDNFGQCICPSGYTGEYCWDRICKPPATYSYGICSCPPGYSGLFCEIELFLPTNETISSSSTTGPKLTNTPSFRFQTTTQAGDSTMTNLFATAIVLTLNLLPM